MPVTLTTTENRLIHTLQVLGDKTRFRMFKMLSADSDLCVSEIASQLDISVSAVSQHFRQFELLGLVSKKRHGQRICYELSTDDTFVHALTDIINKGGSK